MDKIVRIPNDQLIVVCDARKALFLKNTGPVVQPELEMVGHLDAESRPAELLESDRPGRRSDGMAHPAQGGQRSAMEARDVGEVLAVSFAEALADHLRSLHRRAPFTGLVIAAPPNFLGLLRKKLNEDLASIPTSEIAKHLTELPVSALQKALIQSMS